MIICRHMVSLVCVVDMSMIYGNPSHIKPRHGVALCVVVRVGCPSTAVCAAYTTAALNRGDNKM